MKRFQIKRIIKNNRFFLAGLMAGSILLGCAAIKQGIHQTSISGTVVSDTGKPISEAKVIAYWMAERESKQKKVTSGLDGSFVLKLPAMPFRIEAIKVGYCRARIEKLDAGAILSDLKLVLKSGGVVEVTIWDLEKSEFEFCSVKAIASEKEYLADKKVSYIESVKWGPSGRAMPDKIIAYIFRIEGIPIGPADVRVRVVDEDLPARRVEVKGGTEELITFNFKSNKVKLSGKVTQLGNPMSKWLIMFRPTDGKPAPPIAARTASDGSYEYKLFPGPYEIQIGPPKVVEKDGIKLTSFEPKFIRFYTVTKTETLNLELSTQYIMVPIELRQEKQAQGPFVITDRRLLQLSGPDPCQTDAEITASSSEGYQTRGIVERLGGDFHLWCNGAKHTWIGRHKYIQGAIALIDSDKDDPLQFRIDKEKGYVYQKGKGTLIMHDGKMIELPMRGEVPP